MHLHKKLLSLALAVFVSSLLSLGAADGYRTFKSADGKEMKAEVVSVAESTVTVKLESNQREIQFPISVLGAEDQTYVRDWAEKNESFRIKIDARKKMKGSDNSKKGNTKTNVRSYVYNVSLQNWGSNSVPNTTLKYRVYKENGSYEEGSQEFEALISKVTENFETSEIGLKRRETGTSTGGS